MVDKILKLDDLDNSLQADDTIRFVYRGKVFDIDLNKKNIDEFDKVMEPWIAAARDMTPIPRSRPQSRAAAKPDEQRDWVPADVRKWCEDNNIEIAAKGRIPEPIIQQYLAATSPNH